MPLGEKCGAGSLAPALEWRPLDAPESAWCTDAAACAGRSGYGIAMPVAPCASGGKLRLCPRRSHCYGSGRRERGGGVVSSVSPPPAARVTVPGGGPYQPRPADNGVDIDCFAQASLPITQFSADLQWLDGRTRR